MSRVKGKNTKPELHVRSLLHRAGFRFRLSSKNVPGKPDIILPKYKAVILVHGCFWHGHDCHLFRWPKSRKEFWRHKIDNNILRDRLVTKELTTAGFRFAIVWECALKGKAKRKNGYLIRILTDWLKSDDKTLIVRGAEKPIS